jgi:acyl-CoA synthetase (NDP forming)
MMTESSRHPASEAVGRLLNPGSIAVVGTLREARFGGYVTTSNLLRFGFKGRIYPVNPQYQHQTVLDLPVYPSVKDVPEPVDLVVTMAGAAAVPGIIADSVQNRARTAVIISDGFGERREEGKRLQQNVSEIARAGGLRLLGPNTIGVANPAIGLITTPYRVTYEKMITGGVALCAQTGLIGPQNMPLEETHYGLSKMCDFGNKCDLDEIDLLDYLAGDPDTRVIAMHLEVIRDGRLFLRKAKEVVARKPVIVLKPGRTGESRRALASHTGSLAGEDRIYDTAFRQAGVIRVDNFRELIDIPKVLATQPLPHGNRLAIITISGGAGVMAIDVASTHGLKLAGLSASTLEKLAAVSPVLASNPVDLGPGLPAYQVPGGIASRLPAMIEAILADENVDCLAMACPWGVRGKIAEVFGPMVRRQTKTMAVWVAGPSLAIAEEMNREFESIGLPTYPDGDAAIKALSVAVRYARIRAGLRGQRAAAGLREV